MKTDGKRTVHYSFKASPEENEIIQKKMETFGISNRSAFIRTMALNGYLLRLDLPELNETVHLVRNISGNVNQITRMMHERGSIYDTDVDEIVEYQKEILEILTKILRRLDSMNE